MSFITKGLFAAAAPLFLLGCSSSAKTKAGVGDASVGTIHESKRQNWVNVDQFPNVTAFCIGANGIYTTNRSNADSVEVIKDDANCKEGGILWEKAT